MTSFTSKSSLSGREAGRGGGGMGRGDGRGVGHPASVGSFIVDDDDGITLNDEDEIGGHLGLMKQVRDRCCLQAQIVGSAMHRATIYQGEQ